MKILEWIKKQINKLPFRFRKKKKKESKFVTIKTSSQDFEDENQEKVLYNIDVNAATQTEQGLHGVSTSSQANGRQRVFDLIDIEQELNALNKKLTEIDLKQKQIEPINFPKNYTVDKDVEELVNILQKHDNKGNLRFSTSAFGKLKDLWQKFENFGREQSLIKSYQQREAERAKDFKKFKQEIEALHIQVSKQIEQADFNSAKSTIRKLETLLKSIQALSVKVIQGKAKENNRIVSNLVTKTLEFKRKIGLKETEIEAKRQSEELKKQQDEAERRRLAEEVKREDERQRREQQELIQRQQEEARRKKEDEKKEELQRLLTKKSNWQDFAEILRENSIYKFYHFTDRANLNSIREKGGLYSWHYCDNNNVFIPKTGGDTLSRELDKRHKLHDYVRLSFCDDHPMQFRLSQSGYNLVVLEVKIDVAFFETTRFSDINAADKGHNQGASLEDLKRVKFTATKRNYVRKDDPDFKFHQAEIMVKSWIPIEYITNINQF